MMNLTARQLSMQNASIFISCIVPVLNEEIVIESFIGKLKQALERITHNYEIIIIDDGSQDATLLKISQMAMHIKQLKILGLSRNFGKEIALTAGLDYASGDVVILLDADFQHPLDLLSTFLDRWAHGYDMVYGLRTNRTTETVTKRNFAKMFYWLMNKLTETDIPPNAGDFRLLDRNVVAALKQFPERTRFMKGLYGWIGFKKIGVPFTVEARAAGKSSFRLRKLFELAITGITSFSSVPLRVWGFIGFIISIIALIYAIYIVTVTLLFGADLPGFPTLAVAVMFFGGVQLLSIGILGEYIARIFTEVKQRPKYLLQYKEGFDENN